MYLLFNYYDKLFVFFYTDSTVDSASNSSEDSIHDESTDSIPIEEQSTEHEGALGAYSVNDVPQFL